MYSDGLIERRRSSLETGISRLEAIAAGVSTKPLPEVADRIIAGMTAGAPADDDIVLVCIRFAPPGPGGDDPGPAAPGPG
jgi:serine phosphatase RsbU (regulator of sigma subunit)